MMKAVLAAVMLSVPMVVWADDEPHWIGLDDTLRSGDVVVSARVVASTALDTRVTSSAASGAKKITGRPFTGMTLIIR